MYSHQLIKLQILANYIFIGPIVQWMWILMLNVKDVIHTGRVEPVEKSGANRTRIV